MSEVPPPDWAALYQQHRDAMYRVAARVLREAGRADEAEDAVMAAMESLMKSPPTNVQNWQAVMVTAAKRRALDLLGSAAVRHEVATDESRRLDSAVDGLADDVAELVDRQRAGAVVVGQARAAGRSAPSGGAGVHRVGTAASTGGCGARGDAGASEPDGQGGLAHLAGGVWRARG